MGKTSNTACPNPTAKRHGEIQLSAVSDIKIESSFLLEDILRPFVLVCMSFCKRKSGMMAFDKDAFRCVNSCQMVTDVKFC